MSDANVSDVRLKARVRRVQLQHSFVELHGKWKALVGGAGFFLVLVVGLWYNALFGPVSGGVGGAFLVTVIVPMSVLLLIAFVMAVDDT